MTAISKMQSHMDLAYARWQEPDNDWSQQEFWDQLSADERVAVFAGNLNQQVCNGGFKQWNDNGYATPETVGFLMRLCKRLNTETASAVFDLLMRFKRVHAQLAMVTRSERGLCHEGEQFAYDAFNDVCDKLDDTFYDINEVFLADVEASL